MPFKRKTEAEKNRAYATRLPVATVKERRRISPKSWRAFIVCYIGILQMKFSLHIILTTNFSLTCHLIA